MFKQAELNDFERRARSVSSLMEVYDAVLSYPGSLDSQVASLRDVRASDLQDAAKGFGPRRSLYSQTGPETEKMQRDPTYPRLFELIDNRAELHRYVSVMDGQPKEAFRLELREVDLGKSVGSEETSPVFGRTKPLENLPERVTLDLRRDLPDTAAGVRWLFHRETQWPLLALDLILTAFRERFVGELEYMRFMYNVVLSAERLDHVLTFTSHGEDAFAVRCLVWMIDRLKEFVPTREEFLRAKEIYSRHQLSSYGATFAFGVALEELMASLDPLRITPLTAIRRGKLLDYDHTLKFWSQIVGGAAQKEYVVVGNLPISEFDHLRRAVNRLVPRGLAPEMDEMMRSRFLWGQTPRETVTRPFPALKGGDIFALVRMYRGPLIQNLRENVAFFVLHALLQPRIRHYNRGDQELGYVHSTEVFPLDGQHSFLALYGQTEGAAKARMTIAGWNLVLGEVRTGAISDQSIRDAISAVRASAKTPATSASEILGRYMMNQSLYFNVSLRQKFLDELDRLTPADVRAIANTYLLDPSVEYEQLILTDCEDWLHPPSPEASAH